MSGSDQGERANEQTKELQPIKHDCSKGQRRDKTRFSPAAPYRPRKETEPEQRGHWRFTYSSSSNKLRTGACVCVSRMEEKIHAFSKALDLLSLYPFKRQKPPHHSLFPSCTSPRTIKNSGRPRVSTFVWAPFRKILLCTGNKSAS